MLKPFSQSFAAMGTDCLLHLYAADAEQADAVFEQVADEVLRIEARYSRYRPDSVLAAINRMAASGGRIEVDGETAALLDYAHACYRKSDGLFDISSGLLRQAWDFDSGRLPEPATIAALLPRIGLDKISWSPPWLTFATPGMELDFGGIGKEYAADQAAAICQALDVRHGVVDLGGDVVVIGPHPDGRPWSIKIRHPRRQGEALAEVMLERGAMATSGDYERFLSVGGKRYCHILNPRSGWPVQGLAAVSVVADQCLVAGSVATIAMLKGVGGVPWLASLGLRYWWADAEGNPGGAPSARADSSPR